MSRPFGFHHTEETKRKIGLSKMGALNPSWKGYEAHIESGRRIARGMYPLKECDLCKINFGIDRHHKDGNPHNNDISNVLVLCRYCHMEEDGRLKKLVLFAIKRSLGSNTKYPSCKLYCKHGHKLEPYPYVFHGEKKQWRWCPICKKEIRNRAMKTYREKQRAKMSRV